MSNNTLHSKTEHTRVEIYEKTPQPRASEEELRKMRILSGVLRNTNPEMVEMIRVEYPLASDEFFFRPDGARSFSDELPIVLAQIKRVVRNSLANK